MSKARIEVDEDLHRALSVQAAKAGLSLKQYVSSLLLPFVDNETWAFLGKDKTAIGQNVAKAEKPKVSKADLTRPRLFDNPEALDEVARLAAAGHSLRAISETTGYARATIAENLKRMKTREEAGGG